MTANFRATRDEVNKALREIQSWGIPTSKWNQIRNRLWMTSKGDYEIPIEDNWELVSEIQSLRENQ